MSSSSNNEFSSSQESDQDVIEFVDDRSPDCSDSEELHVHSEKSKFCRCPCGCRDRAEARLEQLSELLRTWFWTVRFAHKTPDEKEPAALKLSDARFLFLRKLWALFQLIDHHARKIPDLVTCKPVFTLAFEMPHDTDDRPYLKMEFLTKEITEYGQETLQKKSQDLMSDVMRGLLKVQKKYQPVSLPLHIEASYEGPRKVYWTSVSPHIREHTEGTFDIFESLAASFWPDPTIRETMQSPNFMPPIPLDIDFASPTGPDRPKTRPYFSRATVSAEEYHLTADKSRRKFKKCRCGCYGLATFEVKQYFNWLRNTHNKIFPDNPVYWNTLRYYETLRERLNLVCQALIHYAKQVEAWRDFDLRFLFHSGQFSFAEEKGDVLGAEFQLSVEKSLDALDAENAQDTPERIEKLKKLHRLTETEIYHHLVEIQTNVRKALDQLEKDCNPDVLGWEAKTIKDENPNDCKEHVASRDDYDPHDRTAKLLDDINKTIGVTFRPILEDWRQKLDIECWVRRSW
ncbi:hypothetical protein G7054_g14690 [Neopestalotiopsis clavispora]|nr:hypothetical protein G7054_g14690 [Neopestalotiopsis clavispora]